mmetsp:Transcript_26192/g.57736  ORF Transcript_26192/g.57736 Transcript_26192/m.57736 type:complete len:393 (+) Transcript_26192:60-1238(+)
MATLALPARHVRRWTLLHGRGLNLGSCRKTLLVRADACGHRYASQAAQHSGSAQEEEEEAARREAFQRYSEETELFAYPRSRRVPWATLAFLCTSSGLTMVATLYWRYHVCQANTVEDLQHRLHRFEQFLRWCSISWRDLSGGSSLQSLILASICRVGEQPLRLCVDAVALATCGSLLERLHGTRWLITVGITSTVITNAAAAYLHEQVAANEGLPITSSAGSITALSALCSLAYGRWAVWPQVPIPVGWLIAPLLVATGSTAASYIGSLRAHPPHIEVDAETDQPAATLEGHDGHDMRESYDVELDESSAPTSALHLFMAISACEAVEERCHQQCLPPPEDIAVWKRDVLEPALPSQPHLHRDGAWIADVAGVVLAVGVACALRLRRPLAF